MKQSSFTEARWKRALLMSRKKYFPHFERSKPCGFCVEMGKILVREWGCSGRSANLEYGCDQTCPAYEACVKCKQAAMAAFGPYEHEEEIIGQTFLRKVGPRHGVPMPSKKDLFLLKRRK